jgi:hypothetical protein
MRRASPPAARRERQYSEFKAFVVMPGLVPGIHVFLPSRRKDVDGRVKPGHDEGNVPLQTKKHFFSAIRRLLIARLPSRTNVKSGVGQASSQAVLLRRVE